MKKAIIVGGSGTLGSELTKILVESGIVVNVSRRKSTLNAVNIQCDVSKNSDIEKALKELHKNHSDADVLILSNGVYHGHELGKTPAADIDNDFAANITGSIKLVDGLIDIMKKNKGDIVFIGAIGAFDGLAGAAVYSSTKHAVLGYARSLQAALKDDDVRVICVHPEGFGKAQGLMDVTELAKLVVAFLELPRNMQVSHVMINKK